MGMGGDEGEKGCDVEAGIVGDVDGGGGGIGRLRTRCAVGERVGEERRAGEWRRGRLS